MTNITPTQLRKAADLKERIDTLQAELNSILGSAVEVSATEAPVQRKQKRRMSAAGRAAIAAGARARWAKIKGTTPAAPKKKLSAQGIANIRAGVAKRMAAQGKAVQKPKRKRSAAWRAAISAAAKARWAKAKAAGKTTL